MNYVFITNIKNIIYIKISKLICNISLLKSFIIFIYFIIILFCFFFFISSDEFSF